MSENQSHEEKVDETHTPPAQNTSQEPAEGSRETIEAELDQHGAGATPEAESQEPAEGSRETVDAELAHQGSQDTATPEASGQEPAEGDEDIVDAELRSRDEDGNDK